MFQKNKGAYVFGAELLVGDEQLGPFPHLVAGKPGHTEVQEQSRGHRQRDLKNKYDNMKKG